MSQERFIDDLVNILMNEGYTLDSLCKLLVESYGYELAGAQKLLGLISP